MVSLLVRTNIKHRSTTLEWAQPNIGRAVQRRSPPRTKSKVPQGSMDAHGQASTNDRVTDGLRRQNLEIHGYMPSATLQRSRRADQHQLCIGRSVPCYSACNHKIINRGNRGNPRLSSAGAHASCHLLSWITKLLAIALLQSFWITTAPRAFSSLARRSSWGRQTIRIKIRDIPGERYITPVNITRPCRI